MSKDSGTLIQRNLPILLVAAAALIDNKGRILLAQRPEGKAMSGLWEFPGGKVEDGEIPETTLVRELKEELGIRINERDLCPIGFASYSYDNFHLLMPLFICRIWEGEIKALEHQALIWVSAKEIYDYQMPEADILLINQINRYLLN